MREKKNRTGKLFQDAADIKILNSAQKHESHFFLERRDLKNEILQLQSSQLELKREMKNLSPKQILAKTDMIFQSIH